MFIPSSSWLHGIVCAAFLSAGAGAFAQNQIPGKEAPPSGKSGASPSKPGVAPASPSVSAAKPKAPLIPEMEMEPAPGAQPISDAVTAAVSTPVPTMPKRGAYDLTPDQVQRFQKFLPKAFVKLTNRAAFKVVEISDSTPVSTSSAGAAEALMNGFGAKFAKELAMQFFYTGGVWLENPPAAPVKKKKAASPVVPQVQMGPQIALRLLSAEDGVLLQASQLYAAHGGKAGPDLVIVRLGLNDALSGLSLARCAKSLQDVIETAKSKGSEIIIVGPPLAVMEPAEVSLGLTRPYADTMREIASDAGVLFVDLGDLSSLVAVPESAKEPADAFEQIVSQCRRLFDAAAPAPYEHPRPEFFSIQGTRIFSLLTKGPAIAPWKISDAVVTLQSAEKLGLHCSLKNTTKDELKLALLPLVSAGWRPLDTSPEITLKAGEAKAIEIVYASSKESPGTFSSHEPLLRLPILLSGGSMSRIEDVRAEVRPIAFLWKLDTLFNQEKQFGIENFVINTSGAAVKATWSATCLGQKKSGEMSLAPGEKKPAELVFDLPITGEPWRQTSPLTMELTSGSITLHFERTVEISRNLGLKQTVPLLSLADPAKAPAADDPRGVRLKIDADPDTLFLIYDIKGVDLEDRGNGLGAFGCEVGVDARSYGKRLETGAISSLRVFGKAADGTYPFEDAEPWAFGDGYAAEYDARYFRAQLSSTASGARRLTISLPRSYFYLHEWAIGNGNSQIGLRTTLGFWKGPRDDAPHGEYPRDLAYALLANGRHPDDALGLAVLELTDKPTVRWTVNPF